jgi:C_GCAxxG_C_C family probable redox protein
MENKKEMAIQIFTNGYNCAQAVLYSFKDEININGDKALKMACGLGAGMGRNGEVCGAVTGGIITIGAKYGRGENDDKTATENTYAKTKELMVRFQEEHGTYICRELLDGCNLTTEEGQLFFRENDLFNSVCKKCVGSVIQILEDIL